MSETYIIPNPAIDGWMDEKELNWLYTTALEMASVVEVGSWRGRSTSALLSGCKGPVFAVDTWKGSPDEINGTHADAVTQDIFAQFWGNVGQFKNLVPIRMDSSAAAAFFAPKSIDMVFIDGCHGRESVLADLKAWMPVCRCILCGHDLNQGGVMPALQDMKVDYVKHDGSLWSYDMRKEGSV